MITREQLMAYVDGEAEPAEARAVEKAMEEDPAIRAEIEALRAGAHSVRAAFPEPTPTPADEHLAELIRARLAGSGEVVDLSARRAARAAWVRRAAWPAAIAASLIVGISAGWLAKHSDPGLIGPGGAASRSLAGALSAAPSGRLEKISADASVRPVISFRTADGQACRQFAIEGKAPMSGLACRDGSAWRVRALAETTGRSGAYTTAEGPGEDHVSEMVDGLIAGEPMDAAQEAAAISAGWR
ncbi:MAG: hypothetical protein K1X35_02960 [Caulobacteraceae bacterium]|nr:hypothetical protein [Caulobacteraceae bacterium]